MFLILTFIIYNIVSVNANQLLLMEMIIKEFNITNPMIFYNAYDNDSNMFHKLFKWINSKNQMPLFTVGNGNYSNLNRINPSGLIVNLNNLEFLKKFQSLRKPWIILGRVGYQITILF